MKISRVVAALLTGPITVATAASTFSPARPPAIPLAVRSPYLSTWHQAGSDGSNGGYLAGEWSTFWTGQVTAWTGLIKVDGLNYVWMGAPAVSAALVNQVSFNYTSTRSTFTQTVGTPPIVGLTVEFLSPITPNDDTRSSITASYMNVQVYSLDGLSHDVQLYTDISGEWLSGNRNDVIAWANGLAPKTPKIKARTPDRLTARSQDSGDVAPSYTTYGTQTSFIATEPPKETTTTFVPYSYTPYPYPTYAPNLRKANVTKSKKPPKATSSPGVLYHQIYRESQSFPDENSDQALWGNFYYATDNTDSTTYQIAEDTVARANFINNGTLRNTVDPYFRAINVAWPAFAFAIDLGSVMPSATVSSLFTINLMQEQVIEYENGLIGRNETLVGLWTKYFNSELDAISFFYNDYTTSSKKSTKLDNQVQADSIKAGGHDYATITSLAVRQVFGALQLAANGTGDDYYVFMKEISSDGNIQTVDVEFPLSPILMYLNPIWLKLLLEPLLVNQEAGYWPFQFSIHDLGQHYPVALGNNDGIDEQQPLEECGNMVIMALAYAQRANDVAWLKSHYSLLRQFTQFLIQEALIPANQISTDDFAGSLANQTNLALKGIIGIGAMASIANLTGNTADGANFSRIALNYIGQWETLAIDYTNVTYPHALLAYGDAGSHGLLYNLWADKVLNLGLVPQRIYDYQSNYYPTVMGKYGVPLDTRHTYTKLDWEAWVASIASPPTQALFYNRMATWISQTPTNHPLTDLYDVNSGDYPGFDFIARPVVGGLFAQHALSSAPKKPAFKP